jgi:hypothetical protein|tara:strand:- start:1138 stop:1356 length:219 start_codon:yes stop_codon:yes gene_type:complete
MKIRNMILISTMIILVLVGGCAEEKVVENNKLSELQITACNSADDGNTCDTKLEELGIVTKEQCCQILNKCC